MVLDVDDTLYLERDYVRSGFRAVSEHVRVGCGISGFFEQAWALYESGVRGSTFDILRRESPALAAAISTGDMVAIYRAHEPAITLEADAEEFLNTVHGRVNLGIVTDGPANSQWNKVNALGLSRWVDQIVVTGDRGAGWSKPSPRAFRYLQDFFSAGPERCVYLGDNPTKDFVGPGLLGWETVRVRRGDGLHADLVNHGGATRVVSDLRCLRDIFQAD